MTPSIFPDVTPGQHYEVAWLTDKTNHLMVVEVTETHVYYDFRDFRGKRVTLSEFRSWIEAKQVTLVTQCGAPEVVKLDGYDPNATFKPSEGWHKENFDLVTGPPFDDRNYCPPERHMLDTSEVVDLIEDLAEQVEKRDNLPPEVKSVECAADSSAGSQGKNVQLIDPHDIAGMEASFKAIALNPFLNPDEEAYVRDVGALLAERAAWLPLAQAFSSLLAVRSSFRPFGEPAFFQLQPHGSFGGYSCRIHNQTAYGGTIEQAINEAVKKVKEQRPNA